MKVGSGSLRGRIVEGAFGAVRDVIGRKERDARRRSGGGRTEIK
jgi:hypothetical protein